MNNMKLNVTRCKETVVDFGRLKRNFSPFYNNGMEVKRVNSAEILGALIQYNMTWSEHVTKSSRQQGLDFIC